MLKSLPLMALVLVSACATHAPSQSLLAGSEWRFVAIDQVAPANPDSASLAFEDDRLSASVGCNGMGGGWRIEDDRLIAGPLIGTKMYCTGPVWDQEQAIGSLLVASPKIEIEDDRLVLRSGGHEAELERISPPQSGL